MAFHLKYRPNNLESVIGHTTTVTRLTGMVKSGKLPNALLLTGPSSAGKTTLARCFAAAVNGLANIGDSRDYMEMNASAERSIDDIRALIQTSKFRPQHKKRIICIDEAQGVLSNAPAAAALLKPLEEPSKDTIWILCSMEPTKFGTGNGKAIANRCSQFVLEPHTPADLLKQASRIAKGENMKYVMDEEKKVLKAVAKASQEMRTVANLMESLSQFYEGLTDKPKRLTPEHVTSVLASTESSDDKLAGVVLAAVYQGQFKVVQRSLLDISDGFHFVQKLLWLASFALNSAVLEGARHPKVWGSVVGKELLPKAKALSLGQLATVHANLVEIKAKASTFSLDPAELLSAGLFRTIKEIHTK